MGVSTQDTELLHQVMIIDGFSLPAELPSVIAQNAHALRALYPRAKYRLWDGNSLHEVISANFEQELIDAFESLRPYSYKCDLARYCLLYLFGGLYVDLGIRCINQLRPPADVGVASFRDRDLVAPCWTAASNGIIWARPGRREFRIALDYILENCRNKYYGRNALYVSGPVVWGRALAAAKAEKRQQADADDQWIGVSRPLTPDQRPTNVCFVAPDHSLTALYVKRIGGDMSHLGAVGTNNYNTFWQSQSVYGEEMCWSFSSPAIRVTDAARRTETGIGAKPGAVGKLTYGPFIPLEPGIYRLSISLGWPRKATAPGIHIWVTHDKGRRQLHVHKVDEKSAGAPQVIEFEFTVSKPIENVEFQFRTLGPFEAEITQYSLAIAPHGVLQSKEKSELSQSRIRVAKDDVRLSNQTSGDYLMQFFKSPQLVATFPEASIVVFAPHMDDEVIGPGGTIALHRRAGATVTHVYMTDGLRSDPELNARRMPADELERRLRDLGETRKSESRKAAELLGITELIFLDAPDGRLRETPEIVDRVHRILEEKRPKLIYAPSILDNHEDHRATNRILRLALGRWPKEMTSGILIRGYEVWTPGPANRMVDISPVEAVKRQAINFFASQTKFVDYARAILGLNQYRSMVHLRGASTAEAFWECNWDEYKTLVDEVLLNKS